MGRIPAVTSSLSDHEIEPGRHVERGRGAGRRWGRRRLPPLGGNLEFGPLPLDVDTLQTEDTKVFRSKRRHVEVGTVFAGLVAIATAGLVGGLVYRGTRVDLNVTGVRDDAVITTVEAAAMEVKIVLPSRSAAKEAKLRFDGAV